MPDSTELAKYAAAACIGASVYSAVSVLRRGKLRPELPAASPAHASPAKFVNDALAAGPVMTPGTLLVCTQNLAVSGANQVALNLVEGTVWCGNIIVLSPSSGPFAKEFSELGAGVFIGLLSDLLQQVRDVRCAICNTIMTAHNVLELEASAIPTMWILHEWWPGDMLVEELTKRNDKNTSPQIVAEALLECRRTVCVCNSQLELYRPAKGQAVFVGVPSPAPNWKVAAPPPAERPITFLTLGIVCPRKNQHWAVEAFRKFAGERKDVRLLVVGARYIRQYEIDYVEKVKAAIDGDPRIELHNVTSDVDAFYRQSDVLLFTSLNEVTPMVIAESMMRSMPVITTDIAGIPEMFENGVHGFCLPPDDYAPFVDALKLLGDPGAEGQRRRLQMAAAARKHAEETFTNASMVAQYRAIALELAPPIILLDMDGVLVDWDRGFFKAWGGRTPIDRTQSYSMEACVPEDRRAEALELYHAEGFFLGLPPMEGAVEAVRTMAARGFRLLLCTAPVLTSRHCAGEKFEWVRKHLGEEWVGRIVLTTDKTAVRGDILIDDKPKITGSQMPSWRQLVFTAPYNRDMTKPHVRLERWADWPGAVFGMLSAAVEAKAVPSPSADQLAADLRASVAHMPDFSHLLPEDYRKDYLAWRAGNAQGARGELEAKDELATSIARMETMRDAVMNNTSDDFTEVSIFRKGYRSGKPAGERGAPSPAALERQTTV